MSWSLLSETVKNYSLGSGIQQKCLRRNDRGGWLTLAVRESAHLFMITSSTSTSSRSLCRKSDMKFDTDSYVMCPHNTICLPTTQQQSQYITWHYHNEPITVFLDISTSVQYHVDMHGISRTVLIMAVSNRMVSYGDGRSDEIMCQRHWPQKRELLCRLSGRCNLITAVCHSRCGGRQLQNNYVTTYRSVHIILISSSSSSSGRCS